MSSNTNQVEMKHIKLKLYKIFYEPVFELSPIYENKSIKLKPSSKYNMGYMEMTETTIKLNKLISV